MRSFSLIYLFLFLLLFLLFGVGALINLYKIIPRRRFGIIKFIFCIINGAVFTGFIFLYIYPNQLQHSIDYTVYSYFNVLAFTLIIINIPMSVSLILHFIFEKKQKNIIPYMGFIIAVGFGSAMIYGTIFGAKRIIINPVELHFQYLPKSFDGYRIVQISDLHLSNLKNPAKLLKKLENKIDGIDFDLLLFTGDLVNNFANELDGSKNILRTITAKGQCYSILGNHDYGDYTKWASNKEKQDNFDEIVTAQKDVDLILLRNENRVIKNNEDSIFLVGVENWGHSPFPQYADLENALQGIPENAFTIIMTHDPAHWESRIKDRTDVDLTLSGHSHGLQWGIKLAGITFSPAYFTRKNWAGLYRYGSSVLYVNTGIGTVGIPWRMNMPAEITVFTLKRGKIY